MNIPICPVFAQECAQFKCLTNCSVFSKILSTVGDTLYREPKGQETGILVLKLSGKRTTVKESLERPNCEVAEGAVD